MKQKAKHKKQLSMWKPEAAKKSMKSMIQVMWLVITKVRSASFRLVTERHHDILILCAVTHIFAYWTSPVSVTRIIFFIIKCGITCSLCYACIRCLGIILTSRLPLCRISFLSCPLLLS